MKKNIYKISLSACFLLFAAALFLCLFPGKQETLILQYQPSSNEAAATNIRKVMAANASLSNDILAGAKADGFAYNAEDNRLELDGSDNGSLTFQVDSHSLFTLRLKYKLHDDRIAPTEEHILLSHYENGRLTKTVPLFFKDFVDGDLVYYSFPFCFKVAAVGLLLLFGVCLCGMIHYFHQMWKLSKRKAPRFPSGGKAQGHDFGQLLFYGYLIFSVLFTAAVLILRAHNACMTWDESRSYLVYTRYLRLESFPNILTVWSGSTANNHLLNTLAGSLLSRLTDIAYDEFILRLPNVLCGVAYLGLCGCLAWKKRLSPLCFTLLVWNYYLNEFLGAFRGYGMAYSLAFLALLCYREFILSDCQKLGCLTGSIAFLTLAASANTIVLMLTFAILSSAFIKLLQHKAFFLYLKKQWMFYIVLGCCNFFLLQYHMYAQANEDAGYFKRLTAFPPLSMLKDFAGSYTQSRAALVFLVIGLLIFALALLCVLRYRRELKTVFFLPLGVFLLLCTAIQLILRMGFPFGRALVPCLGLFILSFVEAIGISRFYLQRLCHFNDVQINRLASCLSCISISILLLCFLQRISLHSYSEWEENAAYRQIAYEAMANSDTDYQAIAGMHHPMPFYREQILTRYHFDIYSGDYRPLY